jgi:chaperonin cofactor prefoldin
MPFSVEDFHDLVRLLEAHPDWQRELRRLVLTDELLQLPVHMQQVDDRIDRLTEAIRGLAARQERTDERLDALATRVADLAAAQQRTEVRLAKLAAAQQRTEARLAELAAAQQRTEALLEELAAAQQRTEARLEELAAAQQRTEARLEELAVALHRTTIRLDALSGDTLELRFRERGPSMLGRNGFSRPRVLTDADWVSYLDDALEAGTISSADRAELLLVDAAVRTRDAEGEVWLVVEVSSTVDVHDVDRAKRRAALLRPMTGRVRPAVAGRAFTAGAQEAFAGDPDLVVIPMPSSASA